MNNGGLLKAGQKIQISIESMAHEGQGVGRIDGLAVFVEGALKGEKVLARIDKVAKSYAIAHVEEILEPSPRRINPECPAAFRCGGCMLQHLSYEGQLEFKKEKVKDSLQRIGRISADVFDTIGVKNPTGYRNKAQYPVGKVSGQAVLGFYERRTHNIVPSENCMIQHPASNRIARIVKEWIERYNVPVYNEITHRGLVRHVVTRVGCRTGEIMVILVINGDKIPRQQELADLLKEGVPGFKSLVLNINKKKTNVIMGEENITLFGPPYIHDCIGNIKFRLSPISFFQVNSLQVEVLYNKALEYAELTGKETVIDTYCGTGTITLFLAQKAKKVYGIEVVPQAVEDARHNAKINGIKNVEFLEGAAEEVLPELAKKGIMADVVVMDPPRRGCDEKLLEAAVKMSPGRMVYVSCNPATLARDLRFLEDRGYKTEKVQPVDMFPYTYHVECVVSIKRKHN
ncbi:23S rRNA (uracil(1939)-C(5))-methyltransferase RlmD [Thermoanaerobacterium sp. DL9XJH110]|uniref:23S rRNA (uracil(1939)-C(5))-methyltransferase RlmD n=1 Tax=Thermoanaerobacterium sp. DL9XJH110 TaxID=3386643 RepID=UPI003BB6B08C